MSSIAAAKRLIGEVKAEPLFLSFLVAFVVLALTPRIHLQNTLFLTFLVSGALLFGWFIWLRRKKSTGRMEMHTQVHLIPSHYIQALVQCSIFIYWGFYWELIAHNGLLIVAQLIFTYLFDALLSWSRGKSWRIGFGPFPIILSVNLFLCFKDEWFFYQFLLIVLGLLGKEFVTWQRDGRRVHIFNPSAFPLFVFSVILLATDSTNLTWAQEIATKLNNPDHIYLHIFVVGLIVQAFFQVTLVTLSAGLALFVLNFGYTALTGSYWFLDAGIPIAVFLGMHLLVTDPVTSPRNNIGRFVFGFLYGACVFGLYGVLEYLGKPSFYDKLLCVPVLNLFVVLFDSLGKQQGVMFRLMQKLPVSGVLLWRPQRQNILAMAIWILVFSWMYQVELVGNEHPGQHLDFWQDTCDQNVPGACDKLVRVYSNNCNAGNVEHCLALSKLALARKVQSIDTGAESERIRGKDLVFAEAMACELGSTEGCRQLNSQIDSGDKNLLPSLCDEGDAMGCYIIGANNLKGIGQVPDLPTALKYFSASCDLRLGLGCSLVGDLHFYGVAVKKNVSQAVSYYERSCQLSYGPACQKLSDLYLTGGTINRDLALAKWYQRKACAIGIVSACNG